MAKTPGSGRQKGTPNKTTAQIKALAQKYAPVAMKELARIATQGETESARVAAIKELLDRGYGKAAQSITGPDGGALQVIIKGQDAAL